MCSMCVCVERLSKNMNKQLTISFVWRRKLVSSHTWWIIRNSFFNCVFCVARLLFFSHYFAVHEPNSRVLQCAKCSLNRSKQSAPDCLCYLNFVNYYRSECKLTFTYRMCAHILYNFTLCFFLSLRIWWIFLAHSVSVLFTTQID